VHVTNTWFAATDAGTDAAADTAADAAADAVASGLSGLAGVGQTAGADRSALPDECRDMGDDPDPDPAPEPSPGDVPGADGPDAPGTDPGPGTLPRTGADALATALIALLFLIAGGTAVTVSRRMRGGSRAR
jgi:hypothetical protein